MRLLSASKQGDTRDKSLKNRAAAQTFSELRGRFSQKLPEAPREVKFIDKAEGDSHSSIDHPRILHPVAGGFQMPFRLPTGRQVSDLRVAEFMREVMRIIYFADGSRTLPETEKRGENDLNGFLPGVGWDAPAVSYLTPLVCSAD